VPLPVVPSPMLMRQWAGDWGLGAGDWSTFNVPCPPNEIDCQPALGDVQIRRPEIGSM